MGDTKFLQCKRRAQAIQKFNAPCPVVHFFLENARRRSLCQGVRGEKPLGRTVNSHDARMEGSRSPVDIWRGGGGRRECKTDA